MALVLVKTAGALLVTNYAVHVGASWAHHEFCIPKSVWEVAQSLVATASPVCTGLLAVMTATQTNYAAILTNSLVTALTGVLKIV